MNEHDKDSVTENEKPDSELSPTEKLTKDNPDSSRIPGAQNPDSEAIKAEINPNTE